MKRGVVGGVGVLLLAAIPWSTGVSAVAVFVNDTALSLTPPILLEGGSVLVPIEQFGLAVGIETTVEVDRLVLRWSGARRALSAGGYALRDGVPYAMLEWMVGLVGGEIHRVGETWFVETTEATLGDLEATIERVVLRFDRFAPITIEESPDGTEVLLTVHHARLGVQPQLVVLGASGVKSLRLPSEAGGRINLRMTLQSGTAVRTQGYESSGFYSFCFEIAERRESETIVQVGDGLVLHELTGERSAGTVRADWLYVETWRDRYRLVPTFPSAGFETLDSIEELAGSSGAVAAVNLGCPRAPLPVDFLVIGGIPYTHDGGVQEGLGLDMFGSWTFFSGETAVYARHSGGGIPLDDVNRPLLYGEVIAYSPGYVGTIARGVPGSFTVIKVRSGRVVSVYEGPFVAVDPTAVLLVASGDAKGRLSWVRLGDTVALQCGVGPDGTCFTHAFAAGPVLVDSGIPAVASPSSAVDSRRAWTVLATDWHGGLTILSFARETATEQQMEADLLAFLASMPVPVRDAIVVCRCSDSTLVVRDRTSLYRRGSGNLFALALCLVPVSP